MCFFVHSKRQHGTLYTQTHIKNPACWKSNWIVRSSPFGFPFLQRKHFHYTIILLASFAFLHSPLPRPWFRSSSYKTSGVDNFQANFLRQPFGLFVHLKRIGCILVGSPLFIHRWGGEGYCALKQANRQGKVGPALIITWWPTSFLKKESPTACSC